MSVTSFSSEGSSRGGSGDNTKAKEEGIRAVDLHESTRSYDFRVWTVTVDRIRQLESLGYFVEGSAREPEEVTVLELANDEAVVFEEIFTAGLRMPPHLALTEILIKFWV
jgi:hypothetical protein